MDMKNSGILLVYHNRYNALNKEHKNLLFIIAMVIYFIAKLCVPYLFHYFLFVKTLE